MQSAGRPPEPVERLHELIGAVLCPSEHERALDTRSPQQLVERGDLVDFAHLDPGLIDRLDRRLFRIHRDNRRVLGVTLGDRTNVGRERRREESGLPGSRKEPDDTRDVRREAEVEEAIGFVEDKDADFREIQRPPRHEVDQATGRRDRDMDTAPECALLVTVADTSVERGDARRAAPPECLEVRSDLRAELPRRDDDQRERGRGAAIDALEDRERERARLPGAGLRLGEEITARAQVRDRELLHGREARPAEPSCSSVEVWGKCDQGEGSFRGATKKRAALRGPSHTSSGCPNVLRTA